MSTAMRKTASKIEGFDLDGYGPQGRSAWLDIDWREHLRWVEVDGRQVNVCVMGEGPPLLLVHGHSGCWQNWLENIPHFAERYRVIAPDLPGFGASEMPAERISIENYGRFLGQLSDLLDVEDAPIVGNSMGGFVGAEVCIKYPERASALVLISAAGLSTKYIGLSSEFYRRKSVRAFARATNAYATIPEARVATMVRRHRLRRAVLQAVVRYPERLPAPLCAELMRGSGRPAAPYATDAIMDYDFSDRVGEIACPTLIVWGEDDRIVPVEAADAYERAIPRSRKIVLPETGHVPMLERPSAFNSLLDEFLTSVTASSAAPSG
jgi:pimeloyl-ACP methyl ester carboxylesterase